MFTLTTEGFPVCLHVFTVKRHPGSTFCQKVLSLLCSDVLLQLSNRRTCGPTELSQNITSCLLLFTRFTASTFLLCLFDVLKENVCCPAGAETETGDISKSETIRLSVFSCFTTVITSEHSSALCLYLLRVLYVHLQRQNFIIVPGSVPACSVSSSRSRSWWSRLRPAG